MVKIFVGDLCFIREYNLNVIGVYLGSIRSPYPSYPLFDHHLWYVDNEVLKILHDHDEFYDDKYRILSRFSDAVG